METVQRIMERVPVWQGAAQIDVARIAGLTNCNYQVTVDGERFVLRVGGS